MIDSDPIILALGGLILGGLLVMFLIIVMLQKDKIAFTKKYCDPGIWGEPNVWYPTNTPGVETRWRIYGTGSSSETDRSSTIREYRKVK